MRPNGVKSRIIGPETRPDRTHAGTKVGTKVGGKSRENGRIHGIRGIRGNPQMAINQGDTTMVRIGIVGIGFMGMIHYLAAQRLRGARLAAMCSRDPKKLAGDWRGIRGNFGPPGEMMDLGGVKRYDRLEALLADPEIDLVDVCNPTEQHPATAIAALQAGKHVLVEKAIALRARGRRRHARRRRRSRQAADGRARAAVLPRVRLRRRRPSAAARTASCWAAISSASSRGPTGRPRSATPPRPAARRSTCTSTTRTSSAWSAACRARSSPPAWSRAAPSRT